MTMIGMDYNPKAFLGGPGCSTQAIFDILASAADQIMFEGAWTDKQNADVKAYYDQSSTSSAARRTSTSGVR